MATQDEQRNAPELTAEQAGLSAEEESDLVLALTEPGALPLEQVRRELLGELEAIARIRNAG